MMRDEYSYAPLATRGLTLIRNYQNCKTLQKKYDKLVLLSVHVLLDLL